MKNCLRKVIGLRTSISTYHRTEVKEELQSSNHGKSKTIITKEIDGEHRSLVQLLECGHYLNVGDKIDLKPKKRQCSECWWSANGDGSPYDDIPKINRIYSEDVSEWEILNHVDEN